MRVQEARETWGLGVKECERKNENGKGDEKKTSLRQSHWEAVSHQRLLPMRPVVGMNPGPYSSSLSYSLLS